MKRVLACAGALLIAGSIAACVLGDFSVAPAQATSDGGTLAITPGDTRIGILRTQTFTANEPVTWSLVEGDTAGSIDANGKYISPDVTGTFHLVATSTADATKSATVTVTVVPLTIKRLAGVIGGPGNLGGGAKSAHFSTPGGVAVIPSGALEAWIIADTGNGTIRKYDQVTGAVTVLATFPTPYRPGVVVAGSPSQTSFAMWVVDNIQPSTGSSCLLEVDSASGGLAVRAGDCSQPPATVDGPDGTSSQFASLGSMALAPNGDALYVCDSPLPPAGADAGATTSFTGLRRVELATGKTTTILGGFTTCDVTADLSRHVIYFTDGSGFLKSIPEGSTANPPVTPVAPLPSGEVSTQSMTTLTSGGFDDLYAVSASVSTLYHLRFATNAFDAAPFSGAKNDYRDIDGPTSAARFAGVNSINADPTYGRVYVADTSGEAIREIDLASGGASGTVTTLVGAARDLERVDDTPGGPPGHFTQPVAVTLDPSGNAFVADLAYGGFVANNTVRKIDAVTAAISSFSGEPLFTGFDPPTAPQNGAHNVARFGLPFDLLYLNSKIYVVDHVGRAVREIDAVTGDVTTFAGTLNTGGSTDDDAGAGTVAQFNFATYDFGAITSTVEVGGIATDGKNLYVSDTGNYKIRAITVDTHVTTTLAGGTQQGNANGIGTNALFELPAGLAYDSGFLYVADPFDYTIRRVDLSTREVTRFAGVSGTAGSTDGDVNTALFESPSKLVADGLGNLYVAENFAGLQARGQYVSTPQPTPGASLIRRIDLTKNMVTTLAGDSLARGVAEGPLRSTLDCPGGLAVNAKGDLFFTDECDNVLAVIQAVP